MTATGETINEIITDQPAISETEEDISPNLTDDSEGVRRKYYFDGGHVEIAAHLVYELDPEGRQLRVVRFSEYAAEKVRTLYPSAADLRKQWADPALRAEIIAKLEERGKYGPEARAILADLLEKYAEHGTTQFIIPDVLKVPPISQRGNVIEIAKLFGGPEELRQAVADLQALLYAA